MLYEVITDGVVGDDLPEVKRLASRTLQRGDRCLIILPGQDHLEEILAVLRRSGGKLISVIPHKDSLEEIFVITSYSIHYTKLYDKLTHD